MSRSGPNSSSATEAAGAKSSASQSERSSVVFRPESFAWTFGRSAQARSLDVQSSRLPLPSGGFPRWSTTIERLGKPLGELDDVVEVVRIDDRDLEDDPGGVEERDGLQHSLADDPVDVLFVVHEMPNRAKLGMCAELIQARSSRRRLVEAEPRRDCGDPGLPLSLREEIVGVAVEARTLDEDDGVDAVPVEQRAQVGRAEGPRDLLDLRRHPRLRRVRLVPQVDMCVDT